VERVTPNKPKGVPVAGDDHTEVTHPVAPNTPFDDDQTLAAVVPAPTPTAHKAGVFVLEPGAILGEYRIEGKIGEGGMGTVFAAVHPVIGKRAAIKVLRKDLCEDPHSVERFMDEARVVNQIGHPNIVDVFAFGEMVDGRHYLVMEYLKGETLRARMDRSQLDLAEICSILRPLARALEAAHGKGVIHRDLKPDNIYLVDIPDEPPRLKLLDFGIAKLAREDHRISRTATGAMVGTPQYIAPEQAKGHAITIAVDIYSLGGIAFELVTGRPPFTADNAMEIVAKHLMEAPPRPSQLTSVPRELDDLIHGMLAKDPRSRPSLATVCAVIDRVRIRAQTPVPPELVTPTPISAVSTLGASARPLVTPTPLAAQSELVTSDFVIAPRRRWGLIVLLGIGTFAASAIAYLVVSSKVDKSAQLATQDPPKPDPAQAEPPPPRPVVEQTPAVAPADAAPLADAPVEVKQPVEPKPHVVEIKRPQAIKHPDVKPEIKPRVEPKKVEVKKAEPTGRVRFVIRGSTEWNVLVDGVARGATSVLALPVGSHSVTVQLPNQTKTFKIKVEEGSSETLEVEAKSDDKQLLLPGSTTPKKGTP
jgi:eukaryotic-like serine/threonine-protein kinase